MGQEASEWMDEALEPPNRINPLTGMPFGWTEENELDGWESIPRAG